MTGISNQHYTKSIAIHTLNQISNLSNKQWFWLYSMILIIVGFEVHSVSTCLSIGRLKFELAKLKANDENSRRLTTGSKAAQF